MPSEFEGKPIKCRAMVAWKAKEPLSLEEVEVAPPKAGEVRVKILYSALCHTDVYTLSGQDPEGNFPCILGHEGGGIVESVGEGVTDLEHGDYVIPVYVPQCRECDFCQGVMPDKTTRFKCKGKDLYHFMGTSTFSEFTVLAEISVAKVLHHTSMQEACLLGCGVTTGYGAVLNTCKVEEGSTVAVFGLGAVGLAAIIGAKQAKAKQIVAIDVLNSKKQLAMEFGATNFVNPNEVPKDKPFQQYLIDTFDGGFDYTFECIGNVNTMRQALEAAHKGWGVSCIIGVAGAGQEISTRPFQLVTGRTWKGCAFGGYKSRDSMPELVKDYLNGKLRLEKFITHKFKLIDLNEAIDLLHKGESLRSVIKIHD